MATFASVAGERLPEKDLEGEPIIFDSYDIFMNDYIERTWTMVPISNAVKQKMQTYIKYPPRKLQSESYTGPITL